MSFVATNNPTDPAHDGTVENNGFWPPINIGDFRADERLGHDITGRRLRHALIAAMADANRQLADVQRRQTDAGIDTAADIPREAWHTRDHYPMLYTRAVYALAHADVMERYRDYATRTTGEHRGEVRDEAADDYRRDAHNAISEIEGRPHATVALI